MSIVKHSRRTKPRVVCRRSSTDRRSFLWDRRTDLWSWCSQLGASVQRPGLTQTWPREVWSSPGSPCSVTDCGRASIRCLQWVWEAAPTDQRWSSWSLYRVWQWWRTSCLEWSWSQTGSDLVPSSSETPTSVPCKHFYSPSTPSAVQYW